MLLRIEILNVLPIEKEMVILWWNGVLINDMVVITLPYVNVTYQHLHLGGGRRKNKNISTLVKG